MVLLVTMRGDMVPSFVKDICIEVFAMRVFFFILKSIMEKVKVD